jgi:hypothetical protein
VSLGRLHNILKYNRYVVRGPHLHESNIGILCRPVAQRAFGLKPAPGGFGQDTNDGPSAPSPPYQDLGGFASSPVYEAATPPQGFGYSRPGGSPGSGRGDAGEGLQPMPVSAVMAGMAPERGKTVPTGADIMLDALAEEDVAHKARQFLGQQPGLRQP